MVLGADLVRIAIEVLIVIAVGAILWSAVNRLRRGQIEVYRCPACERPMSRAYDVCKHCGADQPVDR